MKAIVINDVDQDSGTWNEVPPMEEGGGGEDAPTFNPAAFFNSVRQSIFGGSLNQVQVDNLNLLGQAVLLAELAPMVIEKSAYIFGTVYHETASTMAPIEEYGKGYGKDYYPWYGRGHVQLTWESNYKKQQAKLGKLDYVKEHNIPYRVHADKKLAMVPETSALICVLGMRDGDFTGKGLSSYIKPGSVDYVNARRIVNGTDRADLIAGYAVKFEAAVREGLK